MMFSRVTDMQYWEQMEEKMKLYLVNIFNMQISKQIYG